MKEGDVYRVYGRRVIGSADVMITKVTEDKIYIKRLRDGAIVETDREFFEDMNKDMIDESTAYGNDCPSGRCE